MPLIIPSSTLPIATVEPAADMKLAAAAAGCHGKTELLPDDPYKAIAPVLINAVISPPLPPEAGAKFNPLCTQCWT